MCIINVPNKKGIHVKVVRIAQRYCYDTNFSLILFSSTNSFFRFLPNLLGKSSKHTAGMTCAFRIMGIMILLCI